ncbi:hypothetical protein AJ79_09716 [Helicocarpus griseus UAMH5409]|uniref:Tyrosinase copper-binding domain-containing protein n=1 Tax=Helicocarpus griseus UAMH5409 TaxID=1447875 RepID=A0A2B7WHR8_9EURO|nr:hypothetical protein AJ79_09716 [Helicocarpus griseus UAMH5409]
MRWTLVLLGASVSSAFLTDLLEKLSPNLPMERFGKFKTLSFQDALDGKDLLEKLFHFQDEDDKDTENTPAVVQSTNAECQANPHMRIEWRRYSHDDRLAFVNGIKCLIDRPASGNFDGATNRYEDLARLHQQNMENIHNNDKFLIWHRYFLWTFEQLLRDECGFDRAFPWWDETRDAGRFAQAPLFTPDYFGSLPAPQNGQAVCITDGAFAGLTCNIGPGMANQPHCLARAVDESQTSQCNNDFVIACNSRRTYAEMHSCAETGPHGYGHNGIGSVMMDVAGSPSDPVFYMHHAFIDRNFRVWQNEDPRRRTTINGNDAGDVPLTMDTRISMGGIRPDVTIRDIMDTLGGRDIGGTPFCYRYDY